MSEAEFTVGDLRRHLEGWEDNTKLTFGGGLTFYRVKQWDDDEVYIEFGEPEADLDSQFRKRNPHIKVAFVRTDNIQWDESGMVGGPIDVSIR